MTKKDQLFLNPMKRQAPFSFDEDVAEVFDDMLNRSVPFYQEIQHLIEELAKHYVTPNSTVYDLGCSTGETIFRLLNSLSTPFNLIGIDNSQAMLDRANKRLEKVTDNPQKVHLECVDLNDAYKIESASFVIINLTLQFITPENRLRLLSTIYNGLQKGGALCLVEKIRPETPQLNELYNGLFHNFKNRNGYSKEEIEGKQDSLKNVLFPNTSTENKLLLKKAGFINFDVFFRWYNFEGMLAVK